MCKFQSIGNGLGIKSADLVPHQALVPTLGTSIPFLHVFLLVALPHLAPASLIVGKVKEYNGVLASLTSRVCAEQNELPGGAVGYGGEKPGTNFGRERIFLPVTTSISACSPQECAGTYQVAPKSVLYST